MPPWFHFDLTTESHVGYHGIISVVYGINNLPITVNMANGKQIQYYGVYPALRGNANGSRIQKYDGQTNTYYVIGAGGETEAVVAVQSSSVNVTYNTWAGGDNIGQISITNLAYNRYYYLKDHLGSIRVTVNSNGNVDSYNDYYPFGLQMPNRNGAGTADGRFKYTGKEQDVETTLDYFGARYYDSWRGQWLSVDPSASSSPDMAPYHYCRNNPLLLFDPTGDKELNALKYARSLNGKYASGLDYSGVKSNGTGWVVKNENQMVCNELIARSYFDAGYADFPAANDKQITWFRNQGWFTTDPSRGEEGDAMYFQENGDLNAREGIHGVIITEEEDDHGVRKYKFRHSGVKSGVKTYDDRFYTPEEIGEIFAGGKKFIGIGSKPDDNSNKSKDSGSTGSGGNTNTGMTFWQAYSAAWRAAWGWKY